MPESKHFQNEIVYPFDLIDRARPNAVLEGYKFEGCTIMGPSVLMPLDEVDLVGCRFETPGADAMCYVIEKSGMRIGVIGLRRCSFEKCILENIGFAGGRKFLARLTGRA